MTDVPPEKTFPREAFIKGSGALVVGFSMAAASAGKGAADSLELVGAPKKDFASYGPYDPNQIDSWIVVNRDNTASVMLGKVELGQGSSTGLLMIAAEELSMSMKQMKVISNDTNVTPNQGSTSGSSSIQGGGKQIRAASAAAANALLTMASSHLGVPLSNLMVKDGVVSGAGKSVKYGDLIGDKLFNVSMAPIYNLAPATPGGTTPGAGLSPGQPGTKPIDQYTLVGKTPGPARIDIPDKVTGKFTYVQNLRIPGMWHGRVVRPRGQGAYGDGTNPVPLAVDGKSIAHVPGAQVVRLGNFVGVVAPLEYSAIQAAAQLKVKWADPPPMADTGNLWQQMREHDSAGLAAASIARNTGNVESAFPGAAKVVSQTYRFHYNGHLPIGPECVVAEITPNGGRIWCFTQNAYGTRTSVQSVLSQFYGGIYPANQLRVTYMEGSSCYGPNPQNDVAQSAAIMSAAVKKPVRVQFMRWDEHGYDDYGPAQMMDIRGAVDGSGNIVATDYTGFQIPYYTTEPPAQMIGLIPAFAATQAPDQSNSGTQYNIPNRRVTGKSLPLENNYLKSTFLRAPLAPQTLFGFEQMIDELAYAANMDPYEFRLQNITNNQVEAARGLALTWDRWKNVLTVVAKLANWHPKVAASKLSTASIVTGRGIAIGGSAGTMTGIVADIEVNKKTGKIVAKHLYGAQDTGLTVYPEGVEGQAVGSMTQGVSRSLVEEVTFSRGRVTSLDWVTYPSLRFKDAPKITFKNIQRTDIPSLDTGTVAANGLKVTGSGEPPLGPVGAAIANAFFDATGVRIREAPMTPARVRAVL